MTLRKKLSFFIIAFCGIVILTATYFLARAKGIDASEIAQRGEIIWQTSTSKDYDFDGKKEKVYLSVYKNKISKRAFISVYENMFSKRETELSGFEEDLVFCPQKIFEDNKKGIICIFGEVGVHSENIQFINFGNLIPISFLDSNSGIKINITSDTPNFDLEMINENISLYVDNRNYDKDPLVDVIRTRYYLDGDRFQYQNLEEIEQEGNII